MNLDQYKTEEPGELENNCYYCGNECEANYCSKECKKAELND